MSRNNTFNTRQVLIEMQEKSSKQEIRLEALTKNDIPFLDNRVKALEASNFFLQNALEETLKRLQIVEAKLSVLNGETEIIEAPPAARYNNALRGTINPSTGREINKSGFGRYIIEIMQNYPDGINCDVLQEECKRYCQEQDIPFHEVSYNTALYNNLRQYKTLQKAGKIIQLVA